MLSKFDQSEYPGLACEWTARLTNLELSLVRRSDVPGMIAAAGKEIGKLRLSTFSDREIELMAGILRGRCRGRMNDYHKARGKLGNWMDAI